MVAHDYASREKSAMILAFFLGKYVKYSRQCVKFAAWQAQTWPTSYSVLEAVAPAVTHSEPMFGGRNLSWPGYMEYWCGLLRTTELVFPCVVIP